MILIFAIQTLTYLVLVTANLYAGRVGVAQTMALLAVASMIGVLTGVIAKKKPSIVNIHTASQAFTASGMVDIQTADPFTPTGPPHPGCDCTYCADRTF